MDSFARNSSREVSRFLWMTVLLSMIACGGVAAIEPTKPQAALVKVEAEVLEVEQLKEPLGSAIYTVKNLETGETIRLFAGPYRSLIQSSGQVTRVTEVLGGMKLTLIYREGSPKDMPEVVFGRVTSSYYG